MLHNFRAEDGVRVVLFGGTRFIGRAVLAELLGHGHEVLVVHRGQHEPEDLPSVPHLHATRAGLRDHAGALARFRPDAALDLAAMTLADAQAALDALPPGLRLVVASSQDVYRAYASVWRGVDTDALPLPEDAPLRDGPYPAPSVTIPGWDLDAATYDKPGVERLCLGRGATVCRLPVVYGEHDYLRREEIVLARLRAGRRRIPVGAANLLWSRGYVGDTAAGLRLALEADVPGEVFNLAEARTWSIELWMRRIAQVAGAEVELVRVPEEKLPDDLRITAAIAQHMLVDTSKARTRLGFRDTDPDEALRRSVAWHLAHPPAGSRDFAADDAALNAS
jgi:nucleoside-diphosphate-sugar epimerase